MTVVRTMVGRSIQAGRSGSMPWPAEDDHPPESLGSTPGHSEPGSVGIEEVAKAMLGEAWSLTKPVCPLVKVVEGIALGRDGRVAVTALALQLQDVRDCLRVVGVEGG